jgi:hypothetical protein
MKDNYVFILDLGDWDFHEGDRDELYDDNVFAKMDNITGFEAEVKMRCVRSSLRLI